MTFRGSGSRSGFARSAFTAILILIGLWPSGASAQDEDIKLTPFRNEIVINLQNERAPQRRALRLDLSESTEDTPTAIVLGDFVSSTGPFVIAEGSVTPSVEVDSESETVKLELKVDPEMPEWRAGEFTSSVRVGGDGFESVTVPVKLLFRSGSPAWGGLIALVALLVGTSVGYLFKSNETPPSAAGAAREARGTRKRVITWAPRLTSLLTVVVIVAYGYDTEYLSNDVFGAGGFSDWLGLFAFGFAAGFSGKTVSEFTTRKAVP